MSDRAWYVRAGGRRWGPLRSADIVVGVRRGLLPLTARVWRRGLPCWEPLTIHFRPPAARIDTWKLLAGLGFTVLLAAAATTIHMLGLERFGSLRTGLALWGGCVALLMGSAAWVSWRGWRRARRLQAFQPVAAGAQRLAALLVLMLAGGVTLIQAVTMPLLYPTLQLREGFRDYVLHVRPGETGRELRIHGSIGPGFSQSLAVALQQQPQLAAIVITSPGGLVDEAMLAARVIGASGLPVIARGECASACILVLLGSNDPRADWNLSLGFHAVSDLHGESDEAHPAVATLAEDARAFMREKGVPEAVVIEAEAFGANEVLAVHAITLAEAGALRGLTDGGHRLIGLDEAKWRRITTLYAGFDPDDPLVGLLELASRSQDHLVSRWAGPLYAALVDETGGGRLGALLGRFSGEMFIEALRSAPDHAVADHTGRTLAQLRSAAAHGRWQDCSARFEGRQRTDPTGAGRADVTGELQSILTLALAADADGWHRRGIPPDARALGLSWAEQSFRESAQAYPDPDRARCMGYVALLERMEAAPVATTAPVMRWLGLPDEASARRP